MASKISRRNDDPDAEEINSIIPRNKTFRLVLLSLLLSLLSTLIGIIATVKSRRESEGANKKSQTEENTHKKEVEQLQTEIAALKKTLENLLTR